ncbi:MAG: aminotransferase class I/II-fold pyridoxal phosphate-dependent enzyme [Rhizobiaceae bacterium]
MSDDFLPYGKQTITQADLDAVARALVAPLMTTGPQVDEFEGAFAKRVGALEAVVCSNGTAALHLASMALGLGPNDTVLAPSQSFLASANGPHYTGARIVFMDCDPVTGLVTPATFLEALERAGGKASAAVIVHLNGEHGDMAGIAAEAKPRGIRLIEDACHAIGTRFDSGGENGSMVEVGSCPYSDIACFSLHPVKTITMGEGGVATTNNPALAKAMRIARSHGMTRNSDDFSNEEMAFDENGNANPWYYEMAAPGYNYRATDLQCALGLSQLAQLDDFIVRRKALKLAYDRLLADFHPHVRAVPSSQATDPCRHLYPVLIDFEAVGKSRASVANSLRERKIGTQVHYIPIHRQPYYRALNPGLTLPGADAYYAQALSLPLFPLMSDSDPQRVIEALDEVLRGI